MANTSVLNQETLANHPTTSSAATQGWKVLFYYNTYRLTLIILLIAASSSAWPRISPGDISASVLHPIPGIIGISLLTYLNIYRRWPSLHIQAHFLFILDIAFITMLSFGQGVFASSTLIFYVTTAAATAILFPLRTSLIYTCICACLIFYKDYDSFLSNQLKLDTYYQTPLYVIGLFSVVVIVGKIAANLRATQSVIKEQEETLSDFDQINKHIVDQIDLGVLFVDQNMRIQMINQSASAMVGQLITRSRYLKGEFATQLQKHIHHQKPSEFSFRIQNLNLHITSTPLNNGHLIQLDNQSNVNHKIQQSKMASVGRMASAISHEIRNPLSAINHAAQLLSPAVTENSEDIELINIIRTHTKRIDQIIESILQRSRPGEADRKEIFLRPWLKVFTDTFRETIESNNTEITFSGQDNLILFDPTQLEQILTNLCHNSIKYAKPTDQNLKIHLHIGKFWDDSPNLTVTDNGQGIPPDKVEHLFEPFYTSDSKSTGLGLFLVKEYCNLNGANIEYVRGNKRQGFVISFQQPEADFPETELVDDTEE